MGEFRAGYSRLAESSDLARLIVNTLSYALFSAALWAGFMALRAWRRGRRGRCTRCAYDLTGLGAGAACPECGSEAIVLLISAQLKA